MMNQSVITNITNSMSYKLALKKKLNKLEEKMQQWEAENEALIASLESDDVQILLDTTEHTSKPHGNEISNITNKLPKNPTTLSVKELANHIVRGCSIKPSLLRTTKSDSYVSSNIVALDVDNKDNNIVSIDEFLALSRQAGLHPFLIYESFSSTNDCPRYRVLYRFNKTITDAQEIDKLYNYVWQQFPDVPLDHSVRYYSILFGGKSIKLLSNSTNIIPDLSNVSFIKKKQAINKATHKHTTVTNEKHITKEEVRANLIALRTKYAGQSMSAKEINQHIKLTDLLNVSIDEVFRCVLPNHNDEHPSARITIDKDNPDEQFYICTCEAMGYRTISLYKELFGLSSTTAAIKEILDLLEAGTEYQKHAKEFIDTLYSNFDYITEDIKLSNKDRTMYLLFLRIAREKAIKPVSNNSNDITFYVSNSFIQNRMKQEGIPGARDINISIAELCSLGLIRKLTAQEKDRQALLETKELTSKKNDLDYYRILDLTDERIEAINNALRVRKEKRYRKYGTNAQRRINTYGYDYVRNNVHTQAYSKKQDKEVFLALTALIDSGARYFSENDINKAIRKRNHRINKQQATKLILDFLGDLLAPFNLEHVRVKKATRKQYGIDDRYKTNSIVYIVKQSDIEYLEEMIQ